MLLIRMCVENLFQFNESHIPGSPIPMLVGKLGADAALVMAHGDGLTKGETGTCGYNFQQIHVHCVLDYTVGLQ